MAVYKRTFTAYDGPLTNERFRFTILSRYAFKTIFESRMTTSYFTACFFPHVIGLAFIYARNNLEALGSLGLGAGTTRVFEFLTVDGLFFARLLSIESWLTF